MAGREHNERYEDQGRSEVKFDYPSEEQAQKA
jgi:hypothetical protein